MRYPHKCWVCKGQVYTDEGGLFGSHIACIESYREEAKTHGEDMLVTKEDDERHTRQVPKTP